MSENFLIIITGFSGTGKTVLSRKLSEYLGVPVINRDHIKELLFDTLDYNELELRKKIGLASFQLLNFFLDKFLQFDKTFIVEGCFDSEYLKNQIDILQQKHKFTPIIVHCYGDIDTIYYRIIKRDKSIERHIGHNGRDVSFWGSLHEFKSKHTEESINKLPNVDGYIFKLDTTNFDKMNDMKVFKSIKSIIND